jgi:hypothetical protein
MHQIIHTETDKCEWATVLSARSVSVSEHYRVSEGKRVSEIREKICKHAPPLGPLPALLLLNVRCFFLNLRFGWYVQRKYSGTGRFHHDGRWFLTESYFSFIE